MKSDTFEVQYQSLQQAGDGNTLIIKEFYFPAFDISSNVLGYTQLISNGADVIS